MILAEERGISTTLFPLSRYIRSREYLLRRETEQLSWRENFDLCLHLFKCQKVTLRPQTIGKTSFFFCPVICDITLYCVAQPVGLFRNKETLGGSDAQRSSYPSAKMWEPWSEQGC